MTYDAQPLVEAIALVGKAHPSHPLLSAVEPFRHFFGPDGLLDYNQMDHRDGSCTRRELLLRFLLLNAVLDQGPDITGVRTLLASVTNHLYRTEVRFLHRPASFFAELGIGVDHILAQHAAIKAVRAAIWAQENQSSATRYNLFMDNARQVLNYAVFRWGVPLALPLLLERDQQDDASKATALVDYLESWPSAEKMSQALKDHERYGLGKAIGDKACHLFAKWMVSGLQLTRRTDTGWGRFSYEVPYDSNAGRVLWRTGFLLRWASEDAYIAAQVIQPGQGKGGTDYIRVTNIRGMGTSRPLSKPLQDAYAEIAVNHLQTHRKPPQKVEIQRIQHPYLMLSSQDIDSANFDDGLIHIGTNYCYNHAQPLCAQCPVRHLCEGHQSNPRLITGFRT